MTHRHGPTWKYLLAIAFDRNMKYEVHVITLLFFDLLVKS